MQDNTNGWDVLVSFFFMSYILALMGGVAYLVQVHDWSPWWFLGAVFFGSAY